MQHTNRERQTVNNISTLVNGAGLNASIKAVDVKSIKAGRYYGKNVGDNAGYMEACVSVEIEYEAGYSISGNYIYKSKNNITDISDVDNLIQYAKEGDFCFGIEYLEQDYLPFGNWTIEVASDEELLTEIIDVGADPYGDDDDRDNELGEAFSFSFDESCQEVAYEMLNNLSPDEAGSQNSPFTDNLKADIDKQVRTAIVEQLATASS